MKKAPMKKEMPKKGVMKKPMGKKKMPMKGKSKGSAVEDSPC